LFLDKNIETAKNIRKKMFAPGSEYGKILGCSRQSVAIIGSHLFVHAGIIDNLISYLEENNITDLNEININIKLWLLSVNKVDDKLNVFLNDQKISPFWVRELGLLESNLSKDEKKCELIKKTIDFYQINDIIIGHTPQSFMNNTDINSTCGRKIWRVDNGSSHAFDNFDHELTKTGKSSRNRRCQVLKITDDSKYEILYFENDKIITKSV
jgi:hypothetical protein